MLIITSRHFNQSRKFEFATAYQIGTSNLFKHSHISFSPCQTKTILGMYFFYKHYAYLSKYLQMIILYLHKNGVNWMCQARNGQIYRRFFFEFKRNFAFYLILSISTSCCAVVEKSNRKI